MRQSLLDPLDIIETHLFIVNVQGTFTACLNTKAIWCFYGIMV